MGNRDVLIVGGGFYGCCLALFLRSIAERITILEARHDLLTRASYANQARIHTGFHYPRSFPTAKRSLQLHRRFMADFAPAVVRDFRMLYGIAREGSKINARRFLEMYQGLGAPLRRSSRADQALFDRRLIEAVFECEESAFNAVILRDILRARLERAGVQIRLGTAAMALAPTCGGGVRVTLAGGETLDAQIAFNATYGRLNHLVGQDEADRLPVKNELAEIALVQAPEQLAGIGVTVMDGPFFSFMPFPARGLHSLTHVRYTPHLAWLNGDGPATEIAPHSRWLHMKRDATRYLPALREAVWRDSLYEVKTVLLKNEVDDGRPILLHRHRGMGGLYSVLGGKVDNIYDLFEALRTVEAERFGRADLSWFA